MVIYQKHFAIKLITYGDNEQLTKAKYQSFWQNNDVIVLLNDQLSILWKRDMFNDMTKILDWFIVSLIMQE